MARARRRDTSWEPADADFNISTVNVPGGAEIINANQVATWGPGTLVRTRGVIMAQWVTGATTTNEPSLVFLTIRKVSLSETGASFTATTAQLDSGEHLGLEEILWTGAILMIASDVNNSGARAAGFIDVDIKAKRRFESAEERLVLEAMAQNGDGSSVRIISALRSLIMF